MIPVFNEVGALERSIRRLHDYLTTRFPFSARVTIADNGSTDGTWEIATRLAAELGSVRAMRLDRQGAGPRARRRLALERRARARLHGRRPLDRPVGAPAARRAAALGAQRPRDRDAARPRLAGRARDQARADLALATTRSSTSPSARGSPTRSAASRRSAPTAPVSCCRSCVTAPGSSTPSCSCSRSAPGCGSTRSRSTGSTIPTRGSTSSRPRSPTCGASPGSLRDVRTRPSRLVAARGARAELRRAGASVRVDRRALDARLRDALPRSSGRWSARRLRTRSRCSSPRSRTPPRTGASPLRSEASANNVRHQFQGLIVFGLALGLTASSLALLHALVPDPTRAVELAAARRREPRSRRSSGSRCSARGSSASAGRRRRARCERDHSRSCGSRGARRAPLPAARAPARPRRRPGLGASRAARRCSRRPRSSTSSTSRPAATRTRSTRPPSRPARRAGRRSSSARSTRRTSSPSTSRRRRSG